MSRYQMNNSESEFQPGSGDLVLRNLVGIASAQDMDELELELLDQLYARLLLEQLPDHRLGVDDLKRWHHQWLGNVYPWAGRERTVNMSKGGFLFAPPTRIPGLLEDFERDCLQRWTPCHGMAGSALVEALAVTHVEFLLIHPFREGNGRLSRLLADVMAVQAGQQPLDYTSWEQHKDGYIAAIHAGMGRDYGPMRRCMAQALGTTGDAVNAPG